MRLKGLIDEDIVNYKKTSMFLIFPECSFKCDKENGCCVCQNSDLANQPIIDISKEDVCERYVTNPLTSAIVCGGLEPFDSEIDLLPFIDTLRRQYKCKDDIVIYTGYTEEELTSLNKIKQNFYSALLKYDNIIVKFGRYIPKQMPHYDSVLGVELASNNQYAKRLKPEVL